MLAAQIPEVQWQIVRREMVISILINAFIPASIIFALNALPPERLFGSSSLVAAMVPAAGLATFVMTLIITLIIRKRVGAGVLSGFDWPQNQRGLYQFIPSNLFIRALALAFVAIVTLVPLGLVLSSLLHFTPLTKTEFLLFNIIFGSAVGFIMTHFIVLPALADRARP